MKKNLFDVYMDLIDSLKMIKSQQITETEIMNINELFRFFIEQTQKNDSAGKSEELISQLQVLLGTKDIFLDDEHIKQLIALTEDIFSSLNIQTPERVFLLTAPFDEAAKTGDGQYAKSLVEGFKAHGNQTDCIWLKEIEDHYTLKLESGLRSIPEGTIPSIYVLQPVANGHTVISGYQCPSDKLLDEAKDKIKGQITLRTPKVVLDKDNTLKYIGYQGLNAPIIVSQDDIEERLARLRSIRNENLRLLDELSDVKNITSKLSDCISECIAQRKIIDELFTAEPVDQKKIDNVITDINNYITLIAGLTNTPSLKNIDLANCSTKIETSQQISSRLKIMKSLLTKLRKPIDNIEKINIPLDAAIGFLAELNDQFAPSQYNEEELVTLINKMSGINECAYDYESDIARKKSTKKPNVTDAFNKALDVAKQDEDRKTVIIGLIKTIKRLSQDKKSVIDIHIRPPDTGILVMPEDIALFREAGLLVNITVHEYKQNYTRRYLQQFTHEILRVADSVLFFNEKDRHNAYSAAQIGSVDSKHTQLWTITPYDLEKKSGLTVASQVLSGEALPPLEVIQKQPNILSFGTIRPGKGFEEALRIATLLNDKKEEALLEAEEAPPFIAVLIAGDPQSREIMESLFIERYGKAALKEFQSQHPYTCKEEQSAEKRVYWKQAKSYLDKLQWPLKNPHLEIHPWCEPDELDILKSRSKYVCRMDDMGMRNNGSAIISVLDVGIVYTKWGCVTDKYYFQQDLDEDNACYLGCVDLGEEKYGLHSKDSTQWKEEEKIQSDFKRRAYARDPKAILKSILIREADQKQHSDDLKKSKNYLTVETAQRLLSEKFTLKKSTRNLQKIFLIAFQEKLSLKEEDTKTTELEITEEKHPQRHKGFNQTKGYAKRLSIFAQNQERELARRSLASSAPLPNSEVEENIIESIKVSQ